MNHQDPILDEAATLMRERAVEPDAAIPWAVMNYVEGGVRCDGLDLGDVTVGYGTDDEMAESGKYPDEWWRKYPPISGDRFRIFVPKEPGEEVRDTIELLMGQIGATPVGTMHDDFDSYDHRGRFAWHFILPHGSPVHGALEKKVDN